jgi:ABC-type nickel/cobalt efflux system permease component RcnA
MNTVELINAAYVGFCTVLILLIAAWIVWRTRDRRPAWHYDLATETFTTSDALPPAELAPHSPAIRAILDDLLDQRAALTRELADRKTVITQLSEKNHALRTERDHLAAELRRLREERGRTETPAILATASR